MRIYTSLSKRHLCLLFAGLSSACGRLGFQAINDVSIDNSDVITVVDHGDITLDRGPITDVPVLDIVDILPQDSQDIVTIDLPVLDTVTDTFTDVMTDTVLDIPTDQPPAQRPWVSGYYAVYARELYPMSEIDFSAITHLLVVSATLQSNTTLDQNFYIDAVNGPNFVRNINALAHAANVKTILTIGAVNGGTTWRTATNSANLASLVQNITQAMTTLGFDGIDISWNGFTGSQDGPGLRSLVNALRTANPNIIVTLQADWVNANQPNVDAFYSANSSLFDQINVITYEMAGPWDGWLSWHSSALEGSTSATPSSVTSTMSAYIASGVPANKLGISIGFFGMCYTAPVTGPMQLLNGATIVGDDNSLSYANIVTNYFSAANYRYDSTTSGAYLTFTTPTGPLQCSYISYEDPTSVAAKGAYVRSRGLGGTAIWTLNEGYLRNNPVGDRDRLLQAVHTAFTP